MGTDAVKDLRDWQRRAAGEQERALRAASKAHARMRRLDEQRAVAETELARAVDELVSTGVSRGQVAAFLGLELSSLGSRPGAGKQRASRRTSASVRDEGEGDTEAEAHPRPPSLA
jgi:hypothetical protein